MSIFNKGQLSRLFKQGAQSIESEISGNDISDSIINDSLPTTSYVDSTSNSVKKQQEIDLSLSRIEGGLENAGRLETALSIALDNDGRMQKEKQKQKTLDVLIQAEQLRIMLLERITELQEEVDHLLKTRDKVSQRLEALQECLENGRKTGDFETNNPLVVEAINQWEQEQGRPWDPRADAADQLILIINDHQGQYDDLSFQLFSKKQEQERLIQELNELDEKLVQDELSSAELDRISNFLNSSEQEEPQVENRVSDESPTFQIIELGSTPKLL